jgi:hypothetical protein
MRHAHHTIGRSSAFGGNKSGNPDSMRQERQEHMLGRRRKRKSSVPAPGNAPKYEVDLIFPVQAVSDQAVAFTPIWFFGCSEGWVRLSRQLRSAILVIF